MTSVALTEGSHELGPAYGSLRVRRARSGLGRRAGHDLVLEITRWSGQASVDLAEPANSTVSVEIETGSLEVREGTGGAMPLTDRDRREIKKQIAGILGGGTASFASTRVIPSGSGGGAIEGTVTLNGKTQPARLQVTDSGSGRYRGSVTLAQTGFGIKPYTGFFGALKLKDEVVVEFEVDLSKAQGSAG